MTSPEGSTPAVPSAAAGAETATFVFADLAGYAALTEAHGDEHAADVAEAFCQRVRALLSDYGAQEVKTIGDALLIRVSDADQAIALATRLVGDSRVETRSLNVRVGMHTGTAVQRGEDWFGGAVNVASRVADAARSGEVLVSLATREAAQPAILPGRFRARGRRPLKNVRDPVELFALATEADDERPQLPVDPVCRITVDPTLAPEHHVYRGVEYHFCSAACARRFRAAPDSYVGRRSSRSSLLVSDEARDSAARRLARAYSKGRINAGELEERTEVVWSARTRADLQAATHDLPRYRRISSPWLIPFWPIIWLGRTARSRVARRRSGRGQGELGR
jgi:adenylate cyclase